MNTTNLWLFAIALQAVVTLVFGFDRSRSGWTIIAVSLLLIGVSLLREILEALQTPNTPNDEESS